MDPFTAALSYALITGVTFLFVKKQDVHGWAEERRERKRKKKESELIK